MRKVTPGILILCGFCFAGQTTFAQCSCFPHRTLSEEFQRADAVFVGKVVRAKKLVEAPADGYDVHVTLEVEETWRQDLERFITVKEFQGSVEGFEPNAKWLLFATRKPDGSLTIFRGCCAMTRRISVAKSQGYFKAFKKMGQKPCKIIETSDRAEQPVGRSAGAKVG